MLVLTILVFITLALKGGMYVYYFKYYLDGADLAVFLENIGFNRFIGGLNAHAHRHGPHRVPVAEGCAHLGVQPVQRLRHRLRHHGHRPVEAAGRPLRQARCVRRRAVRVHAVPAGLHAVLAAARWAG